ncbi:hypothetical protein OPV22_029593 [Ensete ventricosum]|uniref:Uncharacterized protein n=1 Tax=Ensete ventricosum TaxID=4639 RepID=A0AAV8P694_ENSVE|nr:hypothetical protein OPV22_029593 [Ensete ventricosum]
MESRRSAADRGGGDHLEAIRRVPKKKRRRIPYILKLRLICCVECPFQFDVEVPILEMVFMKIKTYHRDCLNMTMCRISVSILPVKIRLPGRGHLLIMIQGELCSGITNFYDLRIQEASDKSDAWLEVLAR